MAGMFTTPKPPTIQQAPVVVSIADQAVQKASDEIPRRTARGRASTFLTNPQAQREDTSQQLGGR